MNHPARYPVRCLFCGKHFADNVVPLVLPLRQLIDHFAQTHGAVVAA